MAAIDEIRVDAGAAVLYCCTVYAFSPRHATREFPQNKKKALYPEMSKALGHTCATKHTIIRVIAPFEWSEVCVFSTAGAGYLRKLIVPS